jgi:co-chaperonin GroES (HSP10)
MLPLGNRLAVTRDSGERVLASGIVLPAPDTRFSHCGVVTAVGRGCELRAGERILYSSRADTFVLDDGSTVDIVEENSVIGTL